MNKKYYEKYCVISIINLHTITYKAKSTGYTMFYKLVTQGTDHSAHNLC